LQAHRSSIAEAVNQVERVLADGVDAVLLLCLFVAAVYSIGDRVMLIKNRGRVGMGHTMEYAEKVEPSDEVVEDKGVRFLIDPRRRCSCSAPRWATKSRNWRRSFCSTKGARRPPAVAVNRCNSLWRPKRINLDKAR
jgi:hypothetical protein